MHRRMFDSFPGLYPLDANGTPFLGWDNPKYLQTLTDVEGRGYKSPRVESHCSGSLEGPWMETWRWAMRAVSNP